MLSRRLMATKEKDTFVFERLSTTNTYSSAARKTEKKPVTPAPIKTICNVHGARKLEKRSSAQSTRRIKRYKNTHGSREVENRTKAKSDRRKSKSFDRSEKASGSRQVGKKPNNQSARTKYSKTEKASRARKWEERPTSRNKKVAPFEAQKVENTHRQQTQSRNRKVENRSTRSRSTENASKPPNVKQKLINQSSTIRPKSRRRKVTRKHEPSNNHDNPAISPTQSPSIRDSELISQEIFFITAKSKSTPTVINNDNGNRNSNVSLQSPKEQNEEESEVVKSDSNNKESHSTLQDDKNESQAVPQSPQVNEYSRIKLIVKQYYILSTTEEDQDFEVTNRNVSKDMVEVEVDSDGDDIGSLAGHPLPQEQRQNEVEPEVSWPKDRVRFSSTSIKIMLHV